VENVAPDILNLTHRILQPFPISRVYSLSSPVQIVLTPGGPSLGARLGPPSQLK